MHQLLAVIEPSITKIALSLYNFVITFYRIIAKNNAVFLLIAIALAILTPILVAFVQLAISRKREFLADASGALLTRYPEGLASALEKISQDTEPLEVANRATAHLFISNPFKGGGMRDWMSTHPPAEKRIQALRGININ